MNSLSNLIKRYIVGEWIKNHDQLISNIRIQEECNMQILIKIKYNE